MDWRSDQRLSELWSLIDAVWAVEEIEVARIKEMCLEQGIEYSEFVEAWERLLDESHEIIGRAEEKIF